MVRRLLVNKKRVDSRSPPMDGQRNVDQQIDYPYFIYWRLLFDRKKRLRQSNICCFCFADARYIKVKRISICHRQT